MASDHPLTKDVDKVPSISVVTATLNCVDIIPELIDSLRKQDDKNFEWVVADGGSTDGTLELLESIEDVDVTISTASDFGVYDAINRAIKLASANYYLVMGADDFAYPDAISSYRQEAEKTGADFITAAVYIGGEALETPNKATWKWLYGFHSMISCHSVGCLIRRALHDQVGYYSPKYPISADKKFIMDSINCGASIHRADFIAGRYAGDGFSSKDIAGALSENFRVQLESSAKSIQIALFIFRLLKNYRKL